MIGMSVSGRLFGALDAGLPADYYLRLTGQGTQRIRGEPKNRRVIPMEL
jgi:hypothetical protein